MPDAAIRSKVENDVRTFGALESIWGRAISAAEIQFEMNRIAADTRDAGTLRELFAALHDDPTLIAECLDRPLLADQVARRLYDQDERFGGDDRRRIHDVYASLTSPSSLRAAGGRYHETTWHRGEVDHASGALDLGDEAWRTLIRDLGDRFGLASPPTDFSALPTGRISLLREGERSFDALSILAAGTDEIRVATVSWERVTFDAWWAGVARSYPAEPVSPVVTGLTTPTPRAGGCTDDTWTPTKQDVPDSRTDHVAVFTGSEMLIWGGRRTPDAATYNHNDGWRYSPATDAWARIAGNPALAPRYVHVAVWTGTEMIVWGGTDAAQPFRDGGRYNPISDTWQPVSTTDAPSARGYATAVWTGTQMIVWGGSTGTYLNTGGRYDPSTDSWAETTVTGAPAGRFAHSAVWSGTEMIDGAVIR